MKNSKIPTWVIVLIVIFFIIALIVTAGKFYTPESKEDQEQERLKKEAEEARIKQMEKDKATKALKDELQRLEISIEKCKSEFEKIKIQERKILFYSRLGVGILLITLDCIYLNIFRFQPREILGELLKLNSALLAVYSFFAFISHGTPAKFASYLKSKIKMVLRWYHRSTYSEYDSLLVNKKLTEEIIEALEKPVTAEKKVENQSSIVNN